jgi:hypothetical protein
MLIRHQQIALSDALPGMTLSDAVSDTKGNVLLPTGITLTSAILASLKRHQITSVSIALEALSPAQEAAERTRQIERINWLFRNPTLTALPSPIDSGARETLHQYILNFRSGEQP